MRAVANNAQIKDRAKTPQAGTSIPARGIHRAMVPIAQFVRDAECCHLNRHVNGHAATYIR